MESGGWTEEGLAEALESLTPALRRTVQIGRRFRAQLEPDDILQITFLEAFQQIRQISTRTQDGLLAWLRTMAQNNLHDAIRGLESAKRPDSRTRLVAEDTDLAVRDATFIEQLRLSTTTPSRGIRNEEALTAVRTAIEKLPASYAAVMNRLLAGQSVLQIARDLSRTTGAIHMIRTRGCARLRDLLRSELG